MIALKQHNDIVQKLLKEITNKQNQIKILQKQKSKLPLQSPQLQPTQNQKILNNKISQLNKQYKDKISNLTQQLRSKSNQNKQLKQRLTVRSNIEAKQKQHIAQILKKSYDRKPSSGADYKISALITHYEAQIGKKSKFIETLQKQIKQFEFKNTEIQSDDNQNYKQVFQNENKLKGITLVQHQRQMGKIKIDLSKFKKLYEEKQKQYKNLAKKYGDLTNQYYKIINSYGLQQPQSQSMKNLSNVKSIDNLKRKNNITTQLKTNALQNLLQQMVVSDSQLDDTIHNSLNPGMQYDLQKKDKNQIQVRQNLAVAKLQQIMSILNLNDSSQIVSAITKIKIKSQQFDIIDTVVRSLQVFFYNVGKGKIPKKQLVNALQDLQRWHSKNLQAVDLLDEICFSVGAKREKLSQRIEQLIKIQNDYFDQLKNLKYVQSLSRVNKVLQFIDFFELDKEDLALPQQLIQIQQQLKFIQKYTNEVKIILGINSQKSMQMVLQLTLRYIQKCSAVMNQYQQKNKIKN